MGRVVREILQKTRIGKCYRTTVPEKVREMLKLGMGDEIVWVKEGDKVIVENARREVEV